MAELVEADIQPVVVQRIMYGMRQVHLVSVIVVSNTLVVERAIAEEVAQLAEVSTRVVHVQQIILGMVVLAFAIVVSNTLVAELAIVEEVARLVEASTRVVHVQAYMHGMAHHVLIRIVTAVRVDIVRLAAV